MIEASSEFFALYKNTEAPTTGSSFFKSKAEVAQTPDNNIIRMILAVNL